MSAPVAHPEAVSHSTRKNKSMSAPGPVAHPEAVSHITKKNKSMSAPVAHPGGSGADMDLYMHTYMSLQGVCVSSRGFLFGGLSGGVLSGRFRQGWFLSVHPSVRLHPLQQKTKHHFQF